MKDKLKYLTKHSLKKKIATKWFKAVNILLLILFLFLANIDRIITFFGGNFSEEQIILIKDESNYPNHLEETIQSMSNTFRTERKFKIEKTTEDIEKLKENIKEDENQIILYLKKSDTNYVEAQIISYNEISLTTKQIIETSLQSTKEEIAMVESNLSPEEIYALTAPMNIETITTNPENPENQNMIGLIAAFLFILPCFFLIIMLVQMVGAEINDEKTTRSMEIIISNVSPKVHFLSKIYASTLFVIIQAVLVLIYGGIAIAFRALIGSGISLDEGMLTQMNSLVEMIQSTGILTTMVKGLPLILLLFCSSFLLYAIVAGVLASMTTSIEDFQQLQTPMMLIIAIGYYVALLATQMEGAIFIKALSFIPMLSFLIAPVLFFIGQLSIWELAISTLITIIFTFIAFHFGLRIYKVGILNYSSSKLWQKMFHSLKKK